MDLSDFKHRALDARKAQPANAKLGTLEASTLYCSTQRCRSLSSHVALSPKPEADVAALHRGPILGFLGRRGFKVIAQPDFHGSEKRE